MDMVSEGLGNPREGTKARVRTWLTMVGFWEEYLKPSLPAVRKERKRIEGTMEPSYGLQFSMEELLYYGFLEAIRSQARRRFRRGAKLAFQSIVKEKLKEVYESWLRVQGSLPYSLDEAVSEALKILGEAWRMASEYDSGTEVEAKMGKVIPRCKEGLTLAKRKRRRLPPRLLPIRRDLADGLESAVRQKQLVLEGVIGDLMELGIVAVKDGISPKELLETYRSIMALKKFGVSGVPQGLLEGMLKELSIERLQRLFREAHGLGEGFGALLRAESGGQGNSNPKEAFIGALRHGLFGIEDVSLSEPEPGKVVVRCSALSHEKEAMEIIAAFMEGFFASMGYETIRKDCLKGMAILEFRRSY